MSISIINNYWQSRDIQKYSSLYLYDTLHCMCWGCPKTSLGLLFFLFFPTASARRVLGSCATDLKETHFGGILLSRCSPACLSLAQLVENLSCGTKLFHKQPILFNLIRKIWYPDLKEASSMPRMNNSPSFIAEFGIPQCLIKRPQTSPVLDSLLC